LQNILVMSRDFLYKAAGIKWLFWRLHTCKHSFHCPYFVNASISYAYSCSYRKIINLPLVWLGWLRVILRSTGMRAKDGRYEWKECDAFLKEIAWHHQAVRRRRRTGRSRRSRSL